MPILKYRCTSCGKEFAKIFSNPDNAPQACPVCHASNPEELGPAFRYDQEMIRRALCTSCDECDSGEVACSVKSSS